MFGLNESSSKNRKPRKSRVSGKNARPTSLRPQLESLEKREVFDASFAALELWGGEMGVQSSAAWQADYPRAFADVDGDGRDDVVGFGYDGVYVAKSNGDGFETSERWVDRFGYWDGWRTSAHERVMADVNADGRADVVGFGINGVYVSVSTGDGFEPQELWSDKFGTRDSWNQDQYPRIMADVNGDQKDDIVGFGYQGTYVALSTGDGFAAQQLWSDKFGYRHGWRTESHPRTMADVNGDGRDDVVGFGGNGTYVALAQSNGFGAQQKWNDSFGVSYGWEVDKHPRELADVNGDGLDDVVGFGYDGVWVAISNGYGFDDAQLEVDNFGYDAGYWRVDMHPRLVEDVNADGRADIVGFGYAGTYVAEATEDGFDSPELVLRGLGYDHGYRTGAHPRSVADVNGDGIADLVGFANHGPAASVNTSHVVFQDASGDDSNFTMTQGGSLRFSFDFDDVDGGENVRYTRVEALKDGHVVYQAGPYWGNRQANQLVDLKHLTAGTYEFRVRGSNGYRMNAADILTGSTQIEVLPTDEYHGNFRAEMFDAGGHLGHSLVVAGGGGTDVLKLNVDRASIATINGVELEAFNPADSANGQLTIYRGTVFDTIRLTSGREILFHGIEKLQFADGSTFNLMVTPSDELFSSQWNLHVTDVPGAWRYTTGSDDVLLVSIDTGILATDNGQTVADLTDSRIVRRPTASTNGHGQMAISVMAASQNNGHSTAGINWQSPVWVSNVYSGFGGTDTLQGAIRDAMAYADANGQKVVFQGGIQGDWFESGGTQEQLEALIHQNGNDSLFAIAAGNGNCDIDDRCIRDGYDLSGGVSRLQTNHRNVMSVGALRPIDSNGDPGATTIGGLANARDVDRAWYSNFGRSLTMMAPTDSLATQSSGDLAVFDGTSAANPNMAAIGSLVWSVNTDLPAYEVRQILVETAMDLGAEGRDDSFGFGLVNADAAVRRALALATDPSLARSYGGRELAAPIETSHAVARTPLAPSVAALAVDVAPSVSESRDGDSDDSTVHSADLGPDATATGRRVRATELAFQVKHDQASLNFAESRDAATHEWLDDLVVDLLS